LIFSPIISFQEEIHIFVHANFPEKIWFEVRYYSISYTISVILTKFPYEDLILFPSCEHLGEEKGYIELNKCRSWMSPFLLLEVVLAGQGAT